jgi:transposase InsO family protein
MRGRQPAGPEFVQRLHGSAQSKRRLEIILRTITGELSFTQAGATLGLTTQWLHRLRQQALQAAVEQLEPRPPGRPRRPAAAGAAPAEEGERLRQELQAARLREEIALLLPGHVGQPAPKKAPRAGSGAPASRDAGPTAAPPEPPATGAGQTPWEDTAPMTTQRPNATSTPPAPLPDATAAAACPAVVADEPAGDRSAAAVAVPDSLLAPVSSGAGPAVLELSTHLQRLQERLSGQGGAAEPRPRDSAWQRGARALESAVRATGAALYLQLRQQGLPATTAAARLGVPARTLRRWQHPDGAAPQPLGLGRPLARCDADEANRVVGFLNGQGPWVGLPRLQAGFPPLPRAQLQDLLRCYRHLWASTHPCAGYVLHWQRPGSVWGVDFSQVAAPIDGEYRTVLAVGDLASGLQLCWRPVPGLTAAVAWAELQVLFIIAGAPLVLKLDNGSAFRSGWLKRWLRLWGVWPLYSPPGQPWYNGSIEASIGALKRRTAWQAMRQGHAGAWTSADLEAARSAANTTARPWGAAGPSPAEAWSGRRVVSQSEREGFGAEVRRLEAGARAEAGMAAEEELDHYAQAALHRGVLTTALVEHGLLSLTRRRIPQRIFGRKVANFS